MDVHYGNIYVNDGVKQLVYVGVKQLVKHNSIQCLVNFGLVNFGVRHVSVRCHLCRKPTSGNAGRA